MKLNYAIIYIRKIQYLVPCQTSFSNKDLCVGIYFPVFEEVLILGGLVSVMKMN